MSFVKCVKPDAPLKITFEHDSTATAEIANWRAQTSRLLQLKWIGSAVGVGTAYSYKTVIINLAGRWQNFQKIDEIDGNDVITGTFMPRYNATAQRFAEMIVVNTLAALP